MTTGKVTSSLEATVRLHILDGSGQSQSIDTIIDTGFAGFMNLPIATIASLGLPCIYQDNTQLIDGRIISVDIYSAVVIWNGKPRMIDVQALGGYNLIGMRLLASDDLTMRVIDGGMVSINPVP